MIKFNCPVCNEEHEVPKNILGEIITCSNCNETIRVTSKEIDDAIIKTYIPDKPKKVKKTTSEQKEPKLRKYPLWFTRTIYVSSILFISFLVYVFILRDTWETDNYDKIESIHNRAIECKEGKYIEFAIEYYKEIFAIIGDREITTPCLLNVIDEASYEYVEILSDLYKNAQKLSDKKNYKKSNEVYENILKYLPNDDPNTNDIIKSYIANAKIGNREISQLIKSNLEKIKKEEERIKQEEERIWKERQDAYMLAITERLEKERLKKERLAGKTEENNTISSTRVIGSWIDNRPWGSVSHIMTIFSYNGRWIMKNAFIDDSGNSSSSTKNIVEQSVSIGRKFVYKTSNGYYEHYVIDSNGNLKLYDPDGYISTAIRYRGY